MKTLGVYCWPGGVEAFSAFQIFAHVLSEPPGWVRPAFVNLVTAFPESESEDFICQQNDKMISPMDDK